jgi:excinuclease UvrABC nuclease subunit
VAEAAAVEAFFDTRGESLLNELTAQREQASAEMEFERAAQIHAQFLRVKAAAVLADEIVRPIPSMRAVIVQAAAEAEGDAAAAVFLVEGGSLVGPARLSTLGVRVVKEQAVVGSSLFAQPLMLEAVPLADSEEQTVTASLATAAESDSNSKATTNSVMADSADSPTLNPEERAAQVLGELTARAAPLPKSADELARLSDHLSLVRRWYYRPEKQRVGEVFLPREDASWPVRRILRGAARVALGDPRLVAEAEREQALRSPEDEIGSQRNALADTLPPAQLAP